MIESDVSNTLMIERSDTWTYMHISLHSDNILIASGVVLSLIAIIIATLPVHEAGAKQCNSDNNNNDQNNNSNDDGRTCANVQHSNNRHDSITKNTSPFVLPMPFP